MVSGPRLVAEPDQLVDRVPTGEGLEALRRIATGLQVSAEQVLDPRRQLGKGHVAVDLAGDLAFISAALAAAADRDVVALDCRLADRGPQEADIGDQMLGAGVRAAGEVDVDRLVER